MKRILASLLAVATLAVIAADAQVNPQNLPANTLVGRLGIGSGPGQAIPFATLATQLGGSLAGIPTVSAKAVYGVQCDGVTNDTLAISNAFVGAAGKNLAFPVGTCLTDPQSISYLTNNVPQSILAYGTAFKARASSASPLLIVEDPQGSLNGFTIIGLTLDANSLHAYPLKVHGSQFGRYLVEAKGGTAGGIWLSGEPGYGIYYNSFDGSYSHNNAVGAGWIMKSINNTGNYYIAANDFHGVRSIGNGNHGYDLDYASVGLFGSEAETNTTCGFNIDHAIQVDLYSMHIEANNGTACAFTTTANTNGLRVIGGRTIGSITASAKTNPANFWQTSDANANPVVSPPAFFRVVATGINFNSANTDTAVTFTLPAGVSRWKVGTFNAITLTNASASISTATVGVFTAAAAGGQTIAANQAITVTTAATDTNNNTMTLTVTNAATEAYNDTTIYVRIGTAQGSAATADVVFTIIPLT